MIFKFLQRMVVFFAVLLSASVYAEGAGLYDYGPAPELKGTGEWLNSSPLTLGSLRGKVVLVDFWTYSCINCLRALPYVTGWYNKYKNQGLVVLGVHTPEFPFEKEVAGVKTAINHFHINYPVVQDNRYETWNAFGNEYWPSSYLIDKRGRVVFKHFGEGGYEEMEAVIRQLLSQK